MKCNRVNSTLTFSAALAGLALFVVTPMAHGHGNNPKETTDTEPNTTPYPPPPPKTGTGGPQTNVHGVPPPTTDAMSSMVDPSILIGFDPLIHDASDVLSQVAGAPFDVDVVGVSQPPVDLSPQITVEIFDDTGSVSYSAPSGSTIPAPGTVALLGLAAAAMGRRRRRPRR